MQHLGTQVIKTGRLILRPFKIADAKDMFTNWAADPEVNKFLRKDPMKSLEQVDEYLDYIVKSYENPSKYFWAIELKEIQQVIGAIALNQRGFEIDMRYEIGCYMGKQYWGKGIAIEATKAIISFGFEKLCLKRIEAIHSTSNPKAGCALKACGFTHEATCKNLYTNSLGTHDCETYALLPKYSPK